MIGSSHELEHLGVVLSPGQRHDSTQLEAVVDAISVPRPGGGGRPRKRPDHLIADKGYSYPRSSAAAAPLAVATRYEKRAVITRAMVVIASLLTWLDG